MRRRRAVPVVLLVALLGFALDARAQKAELAAFAGYGFGGSSTSPTSGQSVSTESGVVYGGAFSAPISPTWRIEGQFTRQESRLSDDWSGTHLHAAMERYLAGIQEEKSNGGKLRAFGTFLIGATRFVPDGYESELWFTLGVGLGVKTRLSEHVGLRFEARGYYLPVNANGATVCAGGRCIFAFSGSGMFQGDVSAGVLVAF